MAVCCISEYQFLAQDDNSVRAMTGKEPAQAYQELAIGGGNTQSAVFGAGTKIIRVHVDAACRVAIGPNPVAAVGTAMRMAANSTEFFGVPPGMKLGVITSA